MAKTIGYSSEVITGQIVEAPHVSQSIEAFSAANQQDYDISISGSLKVSGSQFIKPEFLLTQDKFFVLSYDENTGQIFKMQTSSISSDTDNGFFVYQTGSSDNNIVPAKFGCNLANANFATVAGGSCNTASAANVFIGSGINNTASSACSVIGGGEGNFVCGINGFIGGGQFNKASKLSVVVGGINNTSSGLCLNFVGGGISNEAATVAGYGAVVSGNSNKACSAAYDFIGSGFNNKTEGIGGHGVIVNGAGNFIKSCGNYPFIGNGQFNSASNAAAFIGNGSYNCNCSISGSILNGECHFASGSYATVIGGYRNTASGNFSIAGGCRNCVTSSHATIIGSNFSCIQIYDGQNSVGSFIAGGSSHSLCAATGSINANNVIIGGGQARIRKYVHDSGIFAGTTNYICGEGLCANNSTNGKASRNSVILGGGSNLICDKNGNGNENSIVGGFANTILIPCTTNLNYLAGKRNSILGGGGNIITGNVSRNTFNAIINGCGNTICGQNVSTIINGCGNIISGSFRNNYVSPNSIIGSTTSRISGSGQSFIAGGSANIVSGSTASTIVGGHANNVNKSSYSGVFGGCQNIVCDIPLSFNIGGKGNLVKGIIGLSDSSVNIGGRLNSIGGNQTVHLGGCLNSSSFEATASVIAGGVRNTASKENTFIGGGTDNHVLHPNSAIIAARDKDSTQSDTLFTCNICAFGALTKASGTFKIDHPNPEKSQTHDLYHSFVESPTAGDNIYRFNIITVNNEAEIILPEYYRYLNENNQLWVSADGHFGRAFGLVNISATKIKITSNQDGKYNVMLVGTRKDKDAIDAWKGVERLKK